jgi:hypothetical protein
MSQSIFSAVGLSLRFVQLKVVVCLFLFRFGLPVMPQWAFFGLSLCVCLSGFLFCLFFFSFLAVSFHRRNSATEKRSGEPLRRSALKAVGEVAVAIAGAVRSGSCYGESGTCLIEIFCYHYFCGTGHHRDPVC